MRFSILAGACAASFILAVPAMAQDISGTVGGGYAGNADSGGGNVWGVNGSLQTKFGDNWGVEGEGGYHRATPGDADVWNVGGSLFTGMDFGRLAGTVSYDGLSGAHAVSYGVGGDWFVGPAFTLSVRGGGYSSTGTDGGYVGGQAAWYVIPNLAVTGAVDYVSGFGSGITTETGKVEYQFSDSLPLSLYGGYQHVDAGTGSDVFFVGLKFYFGDHGTSLVEHQRTGSLGYLSQGVLPYNY